jgi:hypothetical protein
MSVVLNLSQQCLETAARSAFRTARDALLGGDHSAGARLELLRELLEETDFAALRARHPRLAGGHKCRVRVERSPSGRVTWSILP